MNSQATLVTPEEPQHVKLYFTPDNMRNAAVALDDRQVYTIRSAMAHKEFVSTEIVDAAGARVAKVLHHMLRADTIQWSERSETKLKEWLLAPKDSLSKPSPIEVKMSDGRICVFKLDVARRLAAYSDASSNTPLAWYAPATGIDKAHLALTSGVESIRDEILVAMVLLRLRLGERYALYQEGVARPGGMFGYSTLN